MKPEQRPQTDQAIISNLDTIMQNPSIFNDETVPDLLKRAARIKNFDNTDKALQSIESEIRDQSY